MELQIIFFNFITLSENWDFFLLRGWGVDNFRHWLSKMMIVWQNLPQEVQLKHMWALLVERFALVAVFPEDHCVLRQVLLSTQMTTGTNHTAAWNRHLWRGIAFALENVLLSDFQSFNSASDFKNVVRSNHENMRLLWILLIEFMANWNSMNDARILFDDTILPNHDRTRFGDYLGWWMNDATTADRDITWGWMRKTRNSFQIKKTW